MGDVTLSVLDRIEQHIHEEGLLAPGDHVVLAVSGGPDSTALLHILHSLSADWELQLHVAHMDHGFRGEESRREAQWVERLADSLGLPCTIRYADLPNLIEQHGGNTQEVARETRYRFLLDTAKQVGARVIALGHHADDQAETVLMRIIRGTSLSGMSGMASAVNREDVKLIRPLLRIYKEEILAYLEDRGHTYCMDSSNQARQYTRNRLRLDVMPLLQSFNPQIAQSLNRTADIIRAEDHYLHRLAEREATKLFHRTTGEQVGSREDFLQLDVALQRRVIKLILSYLCAESDIDTARSAQSIHIEQVREAIIQSASASITLHLPSVTFIREYDRLRFVRGFPRGTRDVGSYAYVVSDPNTRVHIAEAKAVLTFRSLQGSQGGGFDIRYENNGQSAYFDLEKLAWPLTVRNRRPGDRIRLMNGVGRAKLKDVMIDLKIPHSVRHTVPIVCDADGQLLWVCGYRRSDHALISDTSKKVLHVTLQQNESLSTDID